MSVFYAVFAALNVAFYVDGGAWYSLAGAVFCGAMLMVEIARGNA